MQSTRSIQQRFTLQLTADMISTACGKSFTCGEAEQWTVEEYATVHYQADFLPGLIQDLLLIISRPSLRYCNLLHTERKARLQYLHAVCHHAAYWTSLCTAFCMSLTCLHCNYLWHAMKSQIPSSVNLWSWMTAHKLQDFMDQQTDLCRRAKQANSDGILTELTKLVRDQVKFNSVISAVLCWSTPGCIGFSPDERKVIYPGLLSYRKSFIKVSFTWNTWYCLFFFQVWSKSAEGYGSQGRTELEHSLGDLLLQPPLYRAYGEGPAIVAPLAKDPGAFQDWFKHAISLRWSLE